MTLLEILRLPIAAVVGVIWFFSDRLIGGGWRYIKNQTRPYKGDPNIFFGRN